MKVVTKIEADIRTANRKDADALVTILSIMLAQFARTIEASSNKVGRVTFDTEIIDGQ